MKVKYPRTYHLPWSEGRTSDDKIQFDLSFFEGKEIVITEKMDGENTSMNRDDIWARSLDSNNHPSRNYVKGIWGSIRHMIPDHSILCGENMYAQHTLPYDNLEDYFLMFSVWKTWPHRVCLSWDETLEMAYHLGLKHVPVLYEGTFNLDFVKEFKVDTTKQEGFVIRLKDGFGVELFGEAVVKWVRKDHVQSENHWMHSTIIPNKLKKNS